MKQESLPNRRFWGAPQVPFVPFYHQTSFLSNAGVSTRSTALVLLQSHEEGGTLLCPAEPVRSFPCEVSMSGRCIFVTSH